MGYEAEADSLKKNFDYYFQRTSHGSTLSGVVHSYLAKMVGQATNMQELYMKALSQ